MTHLINRRIVISLITAWFLFGCKKFITVGPPVTQVASSSVFSSDILATAAQTGIYSNMGIMSYLMAQPCGLLSDELANYSNAQTQLFIYTNNMDGVTNGSTGPWSNAYNFLYSVNAQLEGLSASNAISPAVKRQLEGESKFLRAFFYFYLTQCYGDVPLITSTDYSVNAVMARTPVAQVYKKIISDLYDAQNTLSDHFVDYDDTSATVERVRPTKWAAMALLARVYLYMQHYDSAATFATAVMNNGMFQIVHSLNAVFLKNSNEAIWQLQIPLPTTSNTPDGFYFILLSAPTNVAISKQLSGAFEPGDLRRTSWIKDTIIGGNNYSYPFKYKVKQSSTVSEYVMVLRLSEQYLIRSEARAQQGALDGAIADLDSIRARAGLPGYAGPFDNKDSVLTAILHERQVELFTEWGHRWFDLIRTGQVNAVMNVVEPLKGGSWSMDGHQWLFPIPTTEIQKDPNLKQNPGYQ